MPETSAARSIEPWSILRHAVVRNALSLYGIQFAGYILPLFTFPWVARALGQEKFGLINWAAAFCMYFQTLTEYGFNFSATREIALHREDPARINRIFTATMAARFLLLLVSFVLMAGIVFTVPKMRAEWPVFFISFLTPVAAAIFPQWLFQGLEQMGYITVRELGARVIGLMAIFFLVRTEQDYLWAAAVMAGSNAIAAVVGLVYAPAQTGVRFTRISLAELRQTYIDGWHLFLSTAAMTLYTRSNTFILGLVASDSAVGAFAAAQRPVDAAKSMVFPLSTAIFPHVSRMGKDSRENVIRFIRKYTPLIAAPFALISLIFIVGAPIAVRLLYTHRYDSSIPLMQIMGALPFVVALSAPFGVYFMLGLGYNSEWAKLAMSAGVFNFVLLVPLLFLTRPEVAVSITSVVVECFVLLRTWIFYRQRRNAVVTPVETG
jgi:polysaccharide transporter, PST family